MLGAIERGLTLSDFNELTIGMIFGYIIEYNNERLYTEDNDEEIRIATQDDFDRF